MWSRLRASGVEVRLGTEVQRIAAEGDGLRLDVQGPDGPEPLTASRAFNCTWLLTEALDETWKPTACGFLMHADEGRLIVECDPSRPQAWRAAPYRDVLERWAAAGQEVLIFAGKRGQRLNADGATTPVVRQG
jgi:hypothetical protein